MSATVKRRDNLKLVVRYSLVLLDRFAASAASAQKPEQVMVTIKIIEFQMTKGVETGLSAYFTKVSRAQPFGSRWNTREKQER